MDTFAALAEPTRRHIVEILASGGQMSATDICDRFSISFPAISQHLKILRETELVQVEKRAQRRLYGINPKRILEIETWFKELTRSWNSRFDALDLLLQSEKEIK